MNFNEIIYQNFFPFFSFSVILHKLFCKTYFCIQNLLLRKTILSSNLNQNKIFRFFVFFLISYFIFVSFFFLLSFLLRSMTKIIYSYLHFCEKKNLRQKQKENFYLCLRSNVAWQKNEKNFRLRINKNKFKIEENICEKFTLIV